MLNSKIKSYSAEEMKNWNTKKLSKKFSIGKNYNKTFTEYLSSDEVYYCDAYNTLAEIDKIREQSKLNTLNLNRMKEEIIFRVNNYGKEVAFYDKDNSKKKGYIIPKKEEKDELAFIICNTDKPDVFQYLDFEIYIKNNFPKSKYKIDRNHDGSIKWIESVKVYDTIFDYRSDYSRVVKYNGKYGLIDKNGKELIPPKYDDISFNVSGFEKVKLGDKWAIMNKEGKLLSDFKYDKIELIEGFRRCDNDPIIVNIEGKYGVIDKKGKVIIPIKYSSIKRFYTYDLLKIYESSKSLLPSFYTLTDFSGRNILPLEKCNEIKLLKKDVIIAKVDGKRGLYTIKGEEITPPIYDWICEDIFNKDNKDLFEFCRDKFPSEINEASKSNKKYGYFNIINGKEVEKTKKA